jgi:hypothetical protein
VNGANGTSGVNGANGTSGTSGVNGANGTSGVNGANGTSGTSGVNGANGTSGVNGANGTSGTSGVNGANGTSGVNGANGTSGVNGANGTSGVSGTSGTSVSVSGTTNTVVKFASATTIGNSSITDDGTTVQTSLPIKTTVNNALTFQGGDDSALYDINVANTLGVYGVQNSAVGAIKLGSGGPTLYGDSTGLGIGTTSPSAKLEIQTSVAAASTPANSLTFSNGLDGGHRMLFKSSTGNLVAIDGDILSSGGGTDDGVLRFWTAVNGTLAQRMTILNTGEVGIGTTSPGNKLQVNTALQTEFFGTDNATPESSLTAWGTGAFRGLGTGSAILFAVPANTDGSNIWAQARILGTGDNGSDSNAEGAMFLQTRALYNPGVGGSWNWRTNMVLRASGNVGIGTTAPGAKLHVNGGFLRVEGTSTDQYFLEGVRTSTSTTLRIYDNASNVYYDSYSGMVFRANQNGGSGGFIILNGGNVGIGTTSPTAKLQITSTSAGAATVAAFLVNESVTTNTEVRLAFAANTNNDIATDRYSYISAINTSASNGQALKFATNETGAAAIERMRITSGGSVLIGNTTGTELLSVQGNVASITQNNSSNVGFLFQAGSTAKYIWQYQYTDNAVRLYDYASGERMRITSGGQLLIGSTTSLYTDTNRGVLEVNGASSAIVGLTIGGTNGGYLLHGGTDLSIWNAKNGAQIFGTNNTERLRITSGGDVGIGTTSPGAKLQVYGNMQIYAGSSGNSDPLIFGSETGAPKKAIFLETFWMVYQGHDNEGHKFRSVDAAGASTDDMVIKGNGNVGIGTTSPTELLHVVGGNIKVNNGYAAYFGDSANNNGGRIYVASTTNDFYINQANNAPLYFATNNATKATILGNGNFGINETSPTFKLEVKNTNSDEHFGAIGSAPSLNMMSSTSVPTYQGTIGVATANNHFFTGTTGGELCLTSRGIISGSVLFGNSVGTINASIDTDGTITARGDVVAYGTPSDISFKTNIVPIQGSLDKIQKLEPVSFTWKEGVASNKLSNIKDDLGFIAQQVQEVLPELVRQNDNGTLSLRERGIIPLLVGAIKELKAEIDILKNK